MCDENVDELILRNFQKPAGTNGKERKGQEKRKKRKKKKKEELKYYEDQLGGPKRKLLDKCGSHRVV